MVAVWWPCQIWAAGAAMEYELKSHDDMETYRDELNSSWQWKDLPGMAPDYASPVEMVDYGDLPGGGVR